MALLEVRELSTHFFLKEGVLRAVDHVSFSLERGEILGLVGESGSGKSVTSLSILGLVDPPGRVVGGEVRLEGENLLDWSERQLLQVRGRKIAMIFQEPATSLNPTVTIGEQIGEALNVEYYDAWRRGLLPGLARLAHRLVRPDREGERARRAQAIQLLEAVRLAAPEQRLGEYPYMLSGGMLQRIMIAIALAGNPQVLIADEPTTALDVTIQAQILDILRARQRDFNLAVLLITHDLGVIAEMCNRVAVMYAGRVVETAPVEELFNRPRHPYTVGLLQSIPAVDHKVDRLAAIEGTVPTLINLAPDACHFHSRCPHAMEVCRRQAPAPIAVGQGHTVSCHLYSQGRQPIDLGYRPPSEAAEVR